MKPHKTTAKVGENGKVILDDLPFDEGDEVTVTVEPVKKEGRPWPPEFPLRGSFLKYDDPFEPACPPEEWEALREAPE